ncbi:MAG: hypothetical protein H6557_09315 [Lewinellaceae bacterium]|nr:hypothetical protein [Lewinellaceae bacterium]
MFQHFLLNFCFWREGTMPFPYAPFLDYCVRLRLLEKDGGAWRFRHQILQDYFRERGNGTQIGTD